MINVEKKRTYLKIHWQKLFFLHPQEGRRSLVTVEDDKLKFIDEEVFASEQSKKRKKKKAEAKKTTKSS